MLKFMVTMHTNENIALTSKRVQVISYLAITCFI